METGVRPEEQLVWFLESGHPGHEMTRLVPWPGSEGDNWSQDPKKSTYNTRTIHVIRPMEKPQLKDRQLKVDLGGRSYFQTETSHRPIIVLKTSEQVVMLELTSLGQNQIKQTNERMRDRCSEHVGLLVDSCSGCKKAQKTVIFLKEL